MPNEKAKDKLVQEAIRVFGNRENAEGWLNSEVPALGGRTPISLLHTERGRNEVKRIILMIEYGEFS